jgi:predicted transglutaminase-like cysteine proteinase
MLLLRSVLVALALTTATAAVPQTSTGIPVDLTARAKFAHDPAQLVDRISFINRQVNGAIKPMADDAQYGRDLWVMMPKSGKGDCDDYALTKIAALQDAGFDLARTVRLVLVELTYADGRRDGHAIVAFHLPAGDVAYLDSRSSDLMTRRELKARGYHFFDWKA